MSTPRGAARIGIRGAQPIRVGGAAGPLSRAITRRTQARRAAATTRSVAGLSSNERRKAAQARGERIVGN